MHPDDPSAAPSRKFDLDSTLSRSFAAVSKARSDWRPKLEIRESGRILSVQQGFAYVSGLAGVGADEALSLGASAHGTENGSPDYNGVSGLVFDLDEDKIGVALLGSAAALVSGEEARRTGKEVMAPVGDSLLGRVLNPLGKPLDEGGPLRPSGWTPIERDAPGILDRAPVSIPLQTGALVLDALIPIGRGQRELILGDRQTGKTALATGIIHNQKTSEVICIYCAIGQRGASVARVIGDLRQSGALDHTLVVVANGDDPPGLRYIAPYAATAMAEHFMHSGRHVLIVYDDLTAHARAYRELSLLFRRPPGREAFPGDIFYVHARLLERATQLKPELGGGSLTALPILETEAQNLSAYIPTNLISITDGQILLTPELFRKGILPPVDVGKSVSRVGGKAQLAAYSGVAGDLKLTYVQFLELETFSRFGTRLDAASVKVIERGKRIRECLKQGRFAPLSVLEQIFLLVILESSLLDAIPLDALAQARTVLSQACPSLPESIRQGIQRGEPLNPSHREQMTATAKQALGKIGEPDPRQ